MRHPDGRLIPILMSGAPLRDDGGAIIGGVVAFQDITSLYEVDRLKSEFVSIVSHELRTPLTSIKGALQLLLSELPSADPDHATLMNVALSNTDRLVRIINDILDISKIEAGKLELSPKPLAVAEVVNLSVQNVQHLAQSASLTLCTAIEPGVPAIHVDLDRTIQVMVNLLSNALKFAPPRSEVTLSARRHGRRFRGAFGRRPRPRDSRRQDFAALPEVPAARRHEYAEGARDGPGAGDRESARREAGRQRVGRERGRKGRDVHGDAARRAR